MTSVQISALGKYLPKTILTNHDLARMVDTSDEWIRSRTGIGKRHIVDEDESTSTIASVAAMEVLNKANIDPLTIEMIVVATITPDSPFPSVACKVQHTIGSRNAFAFDISAACSGFVYGIETAVSFIKSGKAKNALVIGAEVFSRCIDWEDRSTCVLFGDGAGAALLEIGEEDYFIGSILRADGSGQELLHIPAGGSAKPISIDTIEKREHFLKMKGLELFEKVVPMICQIILDTCKKIRIPVNDIDCFVLHQANIHIIEEIADGIGVPIERFVCCIEQHANTSSASIPLALISAIQSGNIQPRDIVMLVGFGAGLTCGTSVLRWNT